VDIFLGCSGYPKCKNTGEVPAKLVEEMGLDNKARGTESTPATPTPLLEDEEAA
jgi:ssDNA-binding Zn-finger/Zn-ribbon topoisomerase 1